MVLSKFVFKYIFVKLQDLEKETKFICSRLAYRDVKPTLTYTSKKAWFDIDITYWWIMNVFFPHHLKYQGNANAVLTLENCTAHDMKQFCLPTRLGIKLLPPKYTSHHQPDDMGIIASLKVGYKAFYLWNILEIFDTPGGFERGEVARKRQIRGCMGNRIWWQATLVGFYDDA